MKKIFCLVFISNVLFAQSKLIQVSDLARIKLVNAVKSSPDLSKIIYTVNSIEPLADKQFEYEYINNLYLIDAKNPQVSKALTSGKAGASQPAFSPDMESIAFVRTVSEKSQIFILPLDGGEAWQLTSTKYGASNPIFSADGKKIYFSSSLGFNDLYADSLLNPGKKLPLWSIEKAGFKSNALIPISTKEVKQNPDGNITEIRAYLEKNVEDKKAKVINRLNFQGEATVEPEIRFNHIYAVNVEKNAKANPVTTGFVYHSIVNISHKTNELYFTKPQNQNLHPDRNQANNIMSINLNTGIQKLVLEQKGKNFGIIALSPDGKKLAAVINTPNLLSYGEICLANTDGSDYQIISFDRVPNIIKWQNDNTLYFTANSNGGVPIYKMDIKDKKPIMLSDLNSGLGSFDFVAGNKIAYAYNDINTPSELFVGNLDLKSSVQVSLLNTNWVKEKNLSIPEKRIFKNSKGQNIEYWIMKPTNIVAGKKYPILLNLHGGPTAMWGPGEQSMWHEFQYFCAQGYGVVYPNPRGSGGYGKEFQFANFRDWGAGPQEDVLGAFSEATKESWVDTSRQVITGGSYAGYLVAWIIGHDHRFKAAFSQRGVYDLRTFMGEGNAWRLVPNYFGYPWLPETVSKIEANSPYNFLSNIKTPLLIKHGENDLRTGVIQSEMLYKSMKILGKEVEYVRMPGGTHELSRTGNVRQRIDRILRINEFFQRFISLN